MTEHAITAATDQRLILVTGPSGAGRSTAIRALEDIGYETIDNLPLNLLPQLLEGTRPQRPLALGIDVRNRDFSISTLVETIEGLSRDHGIKAEMLYLDCKADVLMRRYSETRRRHPLSPTEDVGTGIDREIELLKPFRHRADLLLDTSELTPHELKAQILQLLDAYSKQQLAISIHSFSYKYGIPPGVDMIIDVRFLRNPHWDADLRGKDGRDEKVAAYILDDPRFEMFFEKISSLAQMLLPAYIEEGKAHLSIGFGCTGGQHRSVMVTERLAAALTNAGWEVSIRHRELERRK